MNSEEIERQQIQIYKEISDILRQKAKEGVSKKLDTILEHLGELLVEEQLTKNEKVKKTLALIKEYFDVLDNTGITEPSDDHKQLMNKLKEIQEVIQGSQCEEDNEQEEKIFKQVEDIQTKLKEQEEADKQLVESEEQLKQLEGKNSDLDTQILLNQEEQLKQIELNKEISQLENLAKI